MIKILMVCTGNICRSPMAQYVLQDMAAKAGLADQILVDSAGTSSEEVGNAVSRGTVDMLKQYGIPQNEHRPARQVTGSDFGTFDYMLAMDRGHCNYLKHRAGGSDTVINLFLADAFKAGTVGYEDVPDPWYDGQYARTYDLVTKGCTAFLDRLRDEQNL